MAMFILANCNKLPEGTYPSEEYDFVSWDDDIPFPKVSVKNHPAMFQSPPTSQ